jgi:ATP-dependent DNA ligase
MVYPELIDDEPRKFHTKGMTIIQGEAYALGGGTDSFEAFLKRDLLQNPKEAKNRQRQYPLRFRAFDILMKNGKWVKDKPILERKRILKEIVPKGTDIEVSPYSTNLKEFTKEMKKDRTVEGVVFKQLPDGYEEGSSKKWRKLKFKKEADVIVIGYEKGEGRRKDIGSLKVGVYDKGKVKEVANVGTGFTDEELSSLKERLDRGDRIFAKVEYMKVGSQGRLRAPVWVGERKDITVKETHL